MTFEEMYNSFYGEEIDNVKQLSAIQFTGEELKEFVEHCIKQNCIKHVVSGKQPDYKTIRAAAIEFAEEFCKEVPEQKKYCVNDFTSGAQWALSQVACASGAVDKTVSGGTECEHPYYSVYGDLDTCLKCGKVLGG